MPRSAPSVCSAGGAALALVALLLVECTAAPAPDAPSGGGGPASGVGATIPAAYSAASGAQLAMLVAADQGLFHQRGLDVELSLLGGGAAIRALVGGLVVFATMPGPPLVHAVLGGAPVVAVAQDMDALGMAVHAGPGIHDLAALRGRRLGSTTPGTPTYLAARAVLRVAGLQPGADVTLVNAGSTRELVPALTVGVIDATVLSVPFTLRADEAGYPEIADLAALGPGVQIVGNQLASHRDYLAGHPDVAQRFVDAYAAGVRLARADPTAARATLARRLQIDEPALLEATYRAYARLLRDPPVPTPEPWQALLDVMVEVGEVNPAVRTATPEMLIDTRWVSG